MENYGEVIIYQTEDGLTKTNVNMQNETEEPFMAEKYTITTKISG